MYARKLAWYAPGSTSRFQWHRPRFGHITSIYLELDWRHVPGIHPTPTYRVRVYVSCRTPAKYPLHGLFEFWSPAASGLCWSLVMWRGMTCIVNYVQVGRVQTTNSYPSRSWCWRMYQGRYRDLCAAWNWLLIDVLRLAQKKCATQQAPQAC